MISLILILCHVIDFMFTMDGGSTSITAAYSDISEGASGGVCESGI